MERKYYWGKTQNGLVALQCEGCKFKNQLYFNGSFPFIHQNKFRLNFGESFPMHKGIMTLDVIGKGQGSAKKLIKNSQQVMREKKLTINIQDSINTSLQKLKRKNMEIITRM